MTRSVGLEPNPTHCAADPTLREQLICSRSVVTRRAECRVDAEKCMVSVGLEPNPTLRDIRIDTAKTPSRAEASVGCVGLNQNFALHVCARVCVLTRAHRKRNRATIHTLHSNRAREHEEAALGLEAEGSGPLA